MTATRIARTTITSTLSPKGRSSAGSSCTTGKLSAAPSFIVKTARRRGRRRRHCCRCPCCRPHRHHCHRRHRRCRRRQSHHRHRHRPHPRLLHGAARALADVTASRSRRRCTATKIPFGVATRLHRRAHSTTATLRRRRHRLSHLSRHHRLCRRRRSRLRRLHYCRPRLRSPHHRCPSPRRPRRPHHRPYHPRCRPRGCLLRSRPRRPRPCSRQRPRRRKPCQHLKTSPRRRLGRSRRQSPSVG